MHQIALHIFQVDRREPDLGNRFPVRISDALEDVPPPAYLYRRGITVGGNALGEHRRTRISAAREYLIRVPGARRNHRGTDSSPRVLQADFILHAPDNEFTASIAHRLERVVDISLLIFLEHDRLNENEIADFSGRG